MKETKKIQIINPFTILLKNFSIYKDIQTVYNLFLSYPLIILRNKHQVPIENLKKIAGVFGDIYSYLNRGSSSSQMKSLSRYYLDQEYEVIRVSNTVDEKGINNGIEGKEFLNWHSDFSNMNTDFYGSMLYNKKNGHKAVTSFCHASDLLSLLSKKEYEQLKRSNGYHSLHSQFYKLASSSVHREIINKLKKNTSKPSSKPMIMTTIRQQEVLYISPVTLQSIDNNLKVLRYVSLIDKLYHYHHHWKLHDIIIYDNLSLLHKRQQFSGERILYRINFNYKKLSSIKTAQIKNTIFNS